MQTRLGRLAVVAVASFVLGGLTSYGQTWVHGDLNSLASSPSGWVLVALLLLLWARLPTVWSAGAGAASLLLLTQGYTVVAQLRGLPQREGFWLVMAVLVGPFVGLAAAWLRGRSVRAGLACALVAGLGVGESVAGLAWVSETTGFGVLGRGRGAGAGAAGRDGRPAPARLAGQGGRGRRDRCRRRGLPRWLPGAAGHGVLRAS